MKKTNLLLIVTVFLAFACSKNNAVTSGSNNAQLSTGTTNGFGNMGAGNINGVLLAQRFNVQPPGSVSSVIQYQGGATFSSVGKPFSNLYMLFGILNPGEQAGVVKLDSTIFKYNTTSANNNINTYSDTTNNSVYTTAKWNVGGNANFTAFNALVTRGYPTIASTTYLPTTFSKSHPLTINFGTNYSNTDSLLILITDNANTNQFFVYKYAAGNAGSVTFTAAELSGASTTANPEIAVFAKNYSSASTGGKNYVFVMENDVFQFVTITP